LISACWTGIDGKNTLSRFGRTGQELSADDASVCRYYREVFTDFVEALPIFVWETKRPVVASRFTRIPSTAEDDATLRVNALLRVAGSFRWGLVSSSDFFIEELYLIRLFFAIANTISTQTVERVIRNQPRDFKSLAPALRVMSPTSQRPSDPQYGAPLTNGLESRCSDTNRNGYYFHFGNNCRLFSVVAFFARTGTAEKEKDRLLFGM